MNILKPVILLLLFSTLTFAENYSYQPYPVLLVHGFNSEPAGTFGLWTSKGEKSSNKLSTKWDENKDENDEKHLAWSLIKAFSDNGDIDDNSDKDYIDYYPSDSTGKWASKRTDYFYPHEEEGSYTLLNHTFVEAYCS